MLEMYYFTGSNLFGQWYGCVENVIEEFRTFPENLENEFGFNVKYAKLIHIGWSHNIFQFKDFFYIAGDYKSAKQYLEVIELPKEFYHRSNVSIVSDDYRIIIVDKDTCTIRSLNMENNDIKTIRIKTETPIEYNKSKKLKKEDHILKCVASNGTFLFLTSERFVYSGLIPNLIDTSCCVGTPVDIRCGYEHCILLTDVGRVYTWGNGRRLQLGHGDVTILDVPTEVEALAGIKITKIAAGGWHSFALSEFGDLYAWGWNDTGQLGIQGNSKENLRSYELPTLVDIFDDNGREVNNNIIDVDCGSRHSAILLDDYSVWTSGSNKYGQLGFPIENNPSAFYFRKSYSLKFASSVICGQWSTAIV